MSNKICAKSNIEYYAFSVCVLTAFRLIESIRLSHKGKSRLYKSSHIQLGLLTLDFAKLSSPHNTTPAAPKAALSPSVCPKSV